MTARFTDWKEAHRHAQDKANATGLDVAIRRTKEYGQGRIQRVLREQERFGLCPR